MRCIDDQEHEDEGSNFMMNMRWWNWVGVAMLVILLFSYVPISQFVSSDSENIKWIVAYVIVATLLLIKGADR
jgi:hypothetical protein